MKKTVKITENELTSIIENIIKEDLRVGKTVEPEERNIGKSLNLKPTPHIVKSDPDTERKVAIQNVVDRIMKYGRNYTGTLIVNGVSSFRVFFHRWGSK